MFNLDCTFATLAENLACDEVLLESCAANNQGDVLRFWEPNSYGAVLGYTNKSASELDEAACRETAVPICRRSSGGGTVLHGPGSLCYALVLDIRRHEALATISSTNCHIMQRIRAALTPLVNGPLQISGTTDLALANRKFSGNAQRRKKNHVLFHGTFLLDFDLGCMQQFLHYPTVDPDYRAGRDHRDFLVNLHLDAEAVKCALRAEWGATATAPSIHRREIAKLASDKFCDTAWNQRFG